MRITLFLLIAALTLAACTSFHACSSFDKNLEKYNDMLRWHDLDRAALFAAPDISAEFGKRVEEARQARVYDYQVIDTQYNEKTLEASAVVIYSYYLYSSAEVKRVTDNQRWVCTDKGGAKVWKLQSLLPEFK